MTSTQDLGLPDAVPEFPRDPGSMQTLGMEGRGLSGIQGVRAMLNETANDDGGGGGRLRLTLHAVWKPSVLGSSA